MRGNFIEVTAVTPRICSAEQLLYCTVEEDYANCVAALVLPGELKFPLLLTI